MLFRKAALGRTSERTAWEQPGRRSDHRREGKGQMTDGKACAHSLGMTISVHLRTTTSLPGRRNESPCFEVFLLFYLFFSMKDISIAFTHSPLLVVIMNHFLEFGILLSCQELFQLASSARSVLTLHFPWSGCNPRSTCPIFPVNFMKIVVSSVAFARIAWWFMNHDSRRHGPRHGWI